MAQPPLSDKPMPITRLQRLEGRHGKTGHVSPAISADDARHGVVLVNQRCLTKTVLCRFNASVNVIPAFW